MNELVKRLNPIESVRRRLFALSGNRCAFPKCPHPIINKDGQLLAQICHIEAASEDGERFNSEKNNEERRAFENLILLCGTHHLETNNTTVYTLSKMREMKGAHEAHSFVQSTEMLERFIDATSNQHYELPKNFLNLDTSRWDDTSFIEARNLLERIATLPRLTRSLYATALIWTVPQDLSLFVDTAELSIRLHVPAATLEPHFAILVRTELVTEWSAEEANMCGRPPFRHFYLRGLDREDYGNYFLVLLNRRYRNEPDVLRDIIENLNFVLLDQ
ncbi:hypothetical protein [Janthinobacterium sp. P210005]|uniref:hypothetical protein n=1 Tax=Janthinobacterium sp. P210005 TaxID=3112938 RepID=UPI002E271DC9|nr:hypothetical protein [Janthinobacterium sp. P210005]